MLECFHQSRDIFAALDRADEEDQFLARCFRFEREAYAVRNYADALGGDMEERFDLRCREAGDGDDGVAQFGGAAGLICEARAEIR
jgi:hypothetical protein